MHNALTGVGVDVSETRFADAPLWVRGFVSRYQRGQSIIDLTASLIIFVIMVTLVMSISMYLYVQHAAVSIAREGARYASLDANLGQTGTVQTGTTEVQNYVITAAQQIAGAQISSSNVVVTPPDPNGTPGLRTTQVTLNFTVQNPLQLDTFLHAFGATGSGFNSFPISATATMRYEE